MSKEYNDRWTKPLRAAYREGVTRPPLEPVERYLSAVAWLRGVKR